MIDNDQTLSDSLDPIDEVDVGALAHQAAAAHMDAVWAAHWEEEDREDDDQPVESPAVGPFCGCDTCVVREVLAGAWPVIEQYYVRRTQLQTLPNISRSAK